MRRATVTILEAREDRSQSVDGREAKADTQELGRRSPAGLEGGPLSSANALLIVEAGAEAFQELIDVDFDARGLEIGRREHPLGVPEKAWEVVSHRLGARRSHPRPNRQTRTHGEPSGKRYGRADADRWYPRVAASTGEPQQPRGSKGIMPSHHPRVV